MKPYKVMLDVGAPDLIVILVFAKSLDGAVSVARQAVEQVEKTTVLSLTVSPLDTQSLGFKFVVLEP